MLDVDFISLLLILLYDIWYDKLYVCCMQFTNMSLLSGFTVWRMCYCVVKMFIKYLHYLSKCSIVLLVNNMVWFCVRVGVLLATIVWFVIVCVYLPYDQTVWLCLFSVVVWGNVSLESWLVLIPVCLIFCLKLVLLIIVNNNIID